MSQKKPMPTNAEWQAAIAPFRKPDARRAKAQVLNTLVPYGVSLLAALILFPISFWASVPFTVLAGLLTVRIFIINHDCGHGSFMADKRLNDLLGFWTGTLSFTPYWRWRHGHAIHHAHSGDVRHDGTGYIWMMTTNQYDAATPVQRLLYRLYRNPLILLGVGATWLFMIEYRWSTKGDDRRMFRDVWATNLFWAAFCTLVGFTAGPMAILGVVLPMAILGTSFGVWLFYFQHHYDEAYFGSETEWDFTRAALEGSSYLKLPRWLQWFSGNIGFHHIHHLSPKIPNYKLEECHNAVSFFRDVKPLTFWGCVRAVRLNIIDSDTGRWTTFRAAGKKRKARLVAAKVALAAAAAPIIVPPQ